jgi:prepilin-type N-terminal cleavage/methylation domain-containing protein
MERAMLLRKPRAGFTLIEIMIVVALIGILSAVAIPGYKNYQARSRRTEAYMNLSAMIRTEDAYYAEHQAYVGMAGGSPPSVPGPPDGAFKRPWTAADEASFSTIGWSPEGSIYYDYALNVAGCTCPAGTCVIAAAYGDVDGDGILAVVLYSRGTPGSECTDPILGAHPIVTMYNAPATGDQVLPVGVSGQF